jgi:hypothetical protein
VTMIGKQSLACQVSIPPGAVGLASPACRWHGSSLRTIRLLEWSFASCATSWIRRASGFSRSGGDGRLTREYARLAKEVVAIEQDRAGVAIARREFASEGIEPRSDQPHQGCDQRHADQGRPEAA